MTTDTAGAAIKQWRERIPPKRWSGWYDGEPPDCAGHIFIETREVYTTSQRKTIEALKEALTNIRDRDWIENCLDPRWPAELAKRVLEDAALVDGKKEGE